MRLILIGYRTGDFPAFLTRNSGIALENRVETAEEFAGIVKAHRRLGLPGAMILAQPPPANSALDRELVEKALAAALIEAHARDITGKAVTPFLLSGIRDATAGKSLTANMALIVANAGLAGEVARAL